MVFRQGKNPDAFEMRDPLHPVARLVGVVFLIAAVAIAVAALLQPGEAMMSLFMLGFAAVFGVVGLLLATSAGGTHLDTNTGSMVRWSGLSLGRTGVAVSLKTTSHDLGDFDRVELTRRVSKSSSSSGRTTYYPVALAGAGGRETIREPENYMKARSLAESLGGILSLDVHDDAHGEKMVREAEHLDESLAQRMARTGETPDVPTQPAGMRSRMRREGRTLLVAVPPVGFTLIHKAALGILAAIVAVSVVGGGLFFIVISLVFAGIAIRDALQSWEIRADRDSLVVTSKGLLPKTVTIPADELEELFLAKGSAHSPEQMKDVQELDGRVRDFVESAIRVFGRNTIVARSDTASVEIRTPLSTEECEYLVAMLKTQLMEW
ncbi:MAG: hypothetical protein ACLFOY_14915 [Desulfatibacillaceae bacterium]